MQQNADWIERRQYPRFPLGVPVGVLASARSSLDGRVENLSEGGCFVAVSAPVGVGWPVAIRLHVTVHGLCAASGTIVRIGGNGFGVEFVDVNVGFRNFIWDLESTDERGRKRIVTAVLQAEVSLG